jgi:hypothetical protein
MSIWNDQFHQGIDVVFNNNADVEVLSGILTLTRGGSSTSNFDVAATATLNFTTNYTMHPLSRYFGRCQTRSIHRRIDPGH